MARVHELRGGQQADLAVAAYVENLLSIRRISHERHRTLPNRPTSAPRGATMNRMHAILTVSGVDHTGIIAAVATALAEENVNILDVSQTLTSGYFTMILRVKYSEDDITIAGIRAKMNQVAESTQQVINVQSEDLFTAMNEV